MLIVVDVNEHCRLQCLVRNIEVGVIIYNNPALQVITPGIKHRKLL